MKPLRIALVQILPGDTREENLKIGLAACGKAKAAGADIALFPEMWSSGYQIPEEIEKLKGEAISKDSEFDGVAYLPELEKSRDTCILEADGREGIYLADFDMDMLREYRGSEVHGNAYRHPKKYRLLAAEQIEEPFIRSDYRK